MAHDRPLRNRVAALRAARDWSQDRLATAARVSRAEVSAIETGRLVPSTAVALALAGALGVTVESLFHFDEPEAAQWVGAEPPPGWPFWEAAVGSRRVRFPLEATGVGTVPHDGVVPGPAHEGASHATSNLIVAGCDPAVGLLVEAVREVDPSIRVIPLLRGSSAALDLLSQGLVHVAGVHLCTDQGRPLQGAALRGPAGGEVEALRVAAWEEGIACAPRLRAKRPGELLGARLRWINREAGSGARQCLDSLLGPRQRRLDGYDTEASSHRGVAEVIRSGCAEAGVSVRLAAAEARLDFLSVRTEPYELCYRRELAADPRVQALVAAVRSRRYRERLSELPGYDTRHTGDLRRVA